MCTNDCIENEEEDDPQSFCEAVEVDPMSGLVPLTSNISCVGEGEIFELFVFDAAGNELSYRESATASYTFSSTGTYHVQCLVDGMSYTDHVAYISTTEYVSSTLDGIDVTNVGIA